MKKNVLPDVAELIGRMREEIAVMDRKIDTLIGRSSPRPIEAKPSPKQENGFRERVLHKAVCADCKKECEVPFKPSGERPVYCKECFSKRRAGGPFKPRPYGGLASAPPGREIHVNKPEAVEKKKPAARKKRSPGKKKK